MPEPKKSIQLSELLKKAESLGGGPLTTEKILLAAIYLLNGSLSVGSFNSAELASVFNKMNVDFIALQYMLDVHVCSRLSDDSDFNPQVMIEGAGKQSQANGKPELTITALVDYILSNPSPSLRKTLGALCAKLPPASQATRQGGLPASSWAGRIAARASGTPTAPSRTSATPSPAPSSTPSTSWADRIAARGSGTPASSSRKAAVPSPAPSPTKSTSWADRIAARKKK